MRESSQWEFKIEKKIKGSPAREARAGLGRAGVLTTVHGIIHTPGFASVGTKATVKSLTPEQIKEIGAEVVLANTYHLYLEPGEEVLKEAGGLGKFMGWNGPTMTDSGGFQVFSLGANFDKAVGKISNINKPRNIYPTYSDSRKRDDDESNPSRTLAKIDEDGVTFKSYKDGSVHRFTPERSIEIQQNIGADIIFAFDECTSPNAPRDYQREAMERTHRWATRCLARHRELKVESLKLQMGTGSEDEKLLKKETRAGDRQALFGIVQGGRFEDLRKESAKIIGNMDFDGFGIGGSFDKEDIATAVGWVNSILPEEKPRHLLGIGDPRDLVLAIEAGCDLFDCVAPTRNARNGSLFTRSGPINITNAKFVRDFSPIEEGCDCYSCKKFTRGYLSHLFRSDEILANTLASIHNLRFIIRLTEEARKAILDDSYDIFRDGFLSMYSK